MFNSEEKKEAPQESIREAEVSESSHDNSSPEGGDENRVNKTERTSTQNLASVIIILAGLFVGSLLVDVAQLAAGQGFSQKVLRGADVFEFAGKTWVAYNEPQVDVQVLTDDSCSECAPDQALVFLRRYLPTMIANKVDMNSAQGERLAQENSVNTVPAFVFDSEIEETAFFFQARSLFQGENGSYTLNIKQLGLPVGKYLNLPEIDENDIVIGPDEAPVRIIEYSDFQCPFCKAMHPVLMQALEEYDGQIQYVYKHLPLSFHEQANNAALAGACAYEQDRFLDYADTLFENQAAWADTEGTASFKRYAAQLGLNSFEFNRCIDSQRYQDDIDADKQQAEEFGLSGTPSTFVGDQFVGGAATYETVQDAIENQLDNKDDAGSVENSENTSA